MPRPLYRMSATDWPVVDEEGNPTTQGAALIYKSSSYAYLHSARNPHEGLEAAGAEIWADDWVDAWGQNAQTRDRLFYAQVRRDGERLTVRRADITDTDEVLRDRIIPHSWNPRATKRLQDAVDAL